MSEQQRKDLKFKLYVFGFLMAIATPIVVLGPALPMVLDSYRKQPLHPKSPERYLQIAQIQANSMREDDAKQTIKEFLEKFCDESEFDLSGVGSGEGTMHKYFADGLSYSQKSYEVGGLTPWFFPQGKPAPVQKAPKDMVGDALLVYALMVEDIDRKGEGYRESGYIYTILTNLWPQGSRLQVEGFEGIRRAAQRSF